MREPGFYFVRDKEEWYIAEYLGEKWQVPGIKAQYDDKDFAEIDEKQIHRKYTKLRKIIEVIRNG